MKPQHLYTIRWTQPYATDWQRPYIRGLQEQLENVIEKYLEESKNYPDADAVIKSIKEKL
jgi:hypothetical protein